MLNNRDDDDDNGGDNDDQIYLSTVTYSINAMPFQYSKPFLNHSSRYFPSYNI